MKNWAIFLLSFLICLNAYGQGTMTQLRFDLTGGPGDELEEGKKYSMQELMAIKGQEAVISEINGNPFPFFLACPKPQDNYCVSITIICTSSDPVEFTYGFSIDPNGCGAVFDGDDINDPGALMCDLSELGDGEYQGVVAPSCENTENCITVFVYATGEDDCNIDLSLEVDDSETPCESRESNPNRFCISTIPTLSQWGLIILGLCLSVIGIAAFKQRNLVSKEG